MDLFLEVVVFYGYGVTEVLGGHIRQCYYNREGSQFDGSKLAAITGVKSWTMHVWNVLQRTVSTVGSHVEC